MTTYAIRHLGPLRESEVEEITGADAGMIVESRGVLIPHRGTSVLREDGTIKVAVIRPCVSRGRKLRGLPPIYTPSMLQECATIFSGWPMFMDHITEEMQEALRKHGRSVNELGGRLVETWWDGSFTHPDDAKYGFQPGAVLGYALPQPGARAMLEADPEILRLSINAWPTGARRSRAPWNNQEGMLIEGIADEPPGSVDWVIRAGAGGRVLQENEALAVSILEAAYSAAHHDSEDSMNLDGKSTEEIRVILRENFPDVLEGLVEAESVKPPAGGSEGGTPLTEERLAEMLTEHSTKTLGDVRSLLEEHEVDDEERLSEELTRSRTYETLERDAHRLIEGAEGLSDDWKAELKAKYVTLPSGPSRALELIEAADDEREPTERLRESVEADVKRATELINSTGVKPKPDGLGGGGGTEGEEGKVTEAELKENEFIQYMVDSGLAENHEDAVAKLREQVVG